MSSLRSVTQSRDITRGHTPWVVRVDQDLLRLRAIHDVSDQNATSLSNRSRHRASAKEALDEAEQLLRAYRERNALSRWVTSSAHYAAALARLQTAAEELVYCQSRETLLSKLPGLAAAVRNYIGPNDTRREVYLTYLENLRQREQKSDAATVPGATDPNAEQRGKP